MFPFQSLSSHRARFPCYCLTAWIGRPINVILKKKFEWLIINHTLILEVFIFSHILTHWSCTLTPDIAIFEVFVFITLKKFVDVIHPIWQKTECSELCLLGANIESVTDYPKKEKKLLTQLNAAPDFSSLFQRSWCYSLDRLNLLYSKIKSLFSLSSLENEPNRPWDGELGEQLSRNIRTK